MGISQFNFNPGNFELSKRGNIRVSFPQTDASAHNEPSVTINGENSDNIIACCRFYHDFQDPIFKTDSFNSQNGGIAWNRVPIAADRNDTEHAPWNPYSPELITSDAFGNIYLAAKTSSNSLVIYRSLNNGLSWEEPLTVVSAVGDIGVLMHRIACDKNPDSNYFGRVYLFWIEVPGGQIHLAKSGDQGKTWSIRLVGEEFKSDIYYFNICIDKTGAIHIASSYIAENSQISYIQSTNGGDSFSIAQMIMSEPVPPTLHPPYSWAEFYQLNTGDVLAVNLITGQPTICVSGDTIVVAWEYKRDFYDIYRIYYSYSKNKGAIWSESIPLTDRDSTHEQFYPQLAATKSGVIGLTYYESAIQTDPNSIGAIFLIDVKFAAHFPNPVYSSAITFDNLLTITDKPWNAYTNPVYIIETEEPPPAHKSIGNYFGIDTDEKTFIICWTDTRTGQQEIFIDTVYTEKQKEIPPWYEKLGNIPKTEWVKSINEVIDPIVVFEASKSYDEKVRVNIQSLAIDELERIVKKLRGQIGK